MAVIRGTQDNDILRGGTNDTIEGLGGNDTLFAAYVGTFESQTVYSSQLSGGDGDDFLSIDYLVIRYSTQNAFNDGGNGNDTISYSSFGNAISVDLSVNQVRSSGYIGNIIAIENVTSGAGNDTLIGDDLNNNLNGRQGNDFLQGGEGNDTLNGYDGDDFLEGGNGDDFLEGGLGSNSINGGSGTDTAVFSGSTNQYEITVDGDTTTVVWIGGGGVESTDVLDNIEKLKFSNGTFDNGVIINIPDGNNNIPDNGNDSLLNTSFNRFRNKFVGGTYLFANQTESASIVQNFSNTFVLEGEAFKVSSQPADGLVRFNRFANLQVAGTYLFATEGESQSVRQNFSNVFREEGIAFYAYGADAGKGTDYYRLANTQVAGTYLFVSEAEKNSALSQFPGLFRNEGVAFEVG